jgi:hypothetical protein
MRCLFALLASAAPAGCGSNAGQEADAGPSGLDGSIPSSEDASVPPGEDAGLLPGSACEQAQAAPTERVILPTLPVASLLSPWAMANLPDGTIDFFTCRAPIFRRYPVAVENCGDE